MRIYQPDDRRAIGLPRLLRFALREMRSGLRGFYVFVACVALGVAVITAVGALSDALRNGFESQGRSILGGDVTFARMHQRASAAEKAWLAGRGVMSETATMRTMARTLDGSEQSLAELKAIDTSYPLIGSVRLAGGATLEKATHEGGGAAVDRLLLEKLRLGVGDRMRLGTSEVPITAIVEQEPDTITDRVTYGPRVFVSITTLERTGLVQPGSLIRWRYALSLPDAGVAELTAIREEQRKALPETGFLVADRRDPSPQVTRTLERLRQFLTLLGLTALCVGGVGVANAVATFIDRRRKVIATYKSLGASGRTIFTIFLMQVLLIATIGIFIGLAIGMTIPLLLDHFYGEALPIRVSMTVGPWSILSAVIYGYLVSLVFTLWPLGRAELVRAGVLFRDEVAPERVRPRAYVIALTVLVLAALTLFAVLTSDSRRVAIYFCAALIAIFAVFIGLGTLITWLARRSPRLRPAELRLAIGNIGAPGGLTRSIVLSLGAGLSLLVAVALANASLVDELKTRIPRDSPDYFMLDLPRAEREAFATAVAREIPGARIAEAPMLRGRIVRLNGVPVEEIKNAGDAEWVLQGDRGLTYAEEVPTGSKVVAGTWWTPGHAGEPLVSFEVELAKKLSLKVSDAVTVNILGRNVTARVASLREVKWESLAINFVMVFSPSTLRSAPHNLLATITLPKDSILAQEARLSRALAASFPSMTSIRVKDAVAAFEAIFAKVMTAVRVAGSVTLAAGALVLAGALATAQRSRISQAVILKTLGASKWRIIAAHFLEYAVLAAFTTVFSVVLGSISAYIALTQIMDLEFVFSIRAVLDALLLALGLVFLFGSLGTWQVLRAPTVPYLRSQ